MKYIPRIVTGENKTDKREECHACCIGFSFRALHENNGKVNSCDTIFLSHALDKWISVNIFHLLQYCTISLALFMYLRPNSLSSPTVTQ